MSNLEMFEAVERIQNALIQAHVQITNCFAQLEVISKQLQKDIADENK